MVESEMPNHLVLVMGPTSELEVRGIRRAAFRKGDHVMELEEAGLLAAAARADERASALVPRPDRAFHGRRDMAASADSLGIPGLLARARRRRDPSSLELLD
jgi:hypothetical protein